MGRRTQSAAHAADYYIRQQTGRLVALRKRPHLAGGALHKNRRRALSLLHGAKGAAGFNDLASVHPELARQWDYAKNAPLVPADISAGSGRSVWWRCEKGHSWRALIRSRTAGCGCPVCAGRQLLPGENDLASVCPELAKQWDAARNGNQRPQDVLPGTEKKVWWICERGHHCAQQSRCAHAA